MPNHSATLVELPMVTMDPPDSTNFLSCGPVLPSVILSPPPPLPPRRMAPSVNTRTSNLLFKSPASSAGGYTTSNGNSYCSKSQRVQPEVIEPPYWSHRPMRMGWSFSASPAGALATASTATPSSFAPRSSTRRAAAEAGTQMAPVPKSISCFFSQYTSALAFNSRLISTKELLMRWLIR